MIQRAIYWSLDPRFQKTMVHIFGELQETRTTPSLGMSLANPRWRLPWSSPWPGYQRTSNVPLDIGYRHKSITCIDCTHISLPQSHSWSWVVDVKLQQWLGSCWLYLHLFILAPAGPSQGLITTMTKLCTAQLGHGSCAVLRMVTKAGPGQLVIPPSLGSCHWSGHRMMDLRFMIMGMGSLTGITCSCSFWEIPLYPL